MKLTLRAAGLLLGSAVLDGLQGFVLFNAALCGVPSLTGVGAVISAVCALGLVGIAGLGAAFSLLWGAFAWWMTGERLMMGAGVAEAIPGLNALPVFTAASVWWILR